MHIQHGERRVIARALKNKTSLRTIAKRLGRSIGSIGDEIRRNGAGSVYDPWKASRKTRLRRRQSKQQRLKVAMDPRLKRYVLRHLSDDQNPEAVSARLKRVDADVAYTSTKAIYAFVHSVHGRGIERRLYTKRVKRHGGRKRGSVTAGDRTKRRVTDRPAQVEHGTEFGHFEGDFTESGRDGAGSAPALVERKTRYPFLVYAEAKDTRTVNAPLATTLSGVLARSVTPDNDVAFQKHEELSKLINASACFTHAYSSQEKGAVENRNKAIRKFIPKRSDISRRRDTVGYAQEKLRTRFTVVLNGLSPREAWDAEMKKHAESVRSGRPVGVLKVKTGCSV